MRHRECHMSSLLARIRSANFAQHLWDAVFTHMDMTVLTFARRQIRMYRMRGKSFSTFIDSCSSESVNGIPPQLAER